MSRLRGCIGLSALALLAACGTPDPINLPGQSPRPPVGGGGGDTDTVWDGSFDDDGAILDGRCGDPPIANGSFTRAALIESVADCAAWHACQFETAAEDFRDKARALEASDGDSEWHEARHAWRRAMLSWSRVELFQFGPVAPISVDEYQGKGIRNQIYAWPTMSRCRVEEQLVSERYLDGGVDKMAINARGLFASEYLLFYPGEGHGCSENSPTAAAWGELGREDLSKRKRAYAAAVAEDILAKSRLLTTSWGEGNFKDKLLSADKYGDIQEVLNVMAYSLIYMEREVKDWKLGIPAGLTAQAPVDGPETPFAGIGIENIRANFDGFRDLFQGCGQNGEGIGFDDWLHAAGHSDLADDMIAAWASAKKVADDTPPLHKASTAEVEKLYRAVKGLTDLIKGDLFGPGSPLGLKLPATVEGDTD